MDSLFTSGQALDYFGILAGLGVTVAGFGFAITQFRNGGNKAKDDLIVTLKENASAEKERADRLAMEKETLIRSHQSQLTALTEKVGKLQGLYESAESQKKEYLSILQGMSPEEVQYRKEMREFAVGVANYMKTTSDVFSAMMVNLNSLNEKVSANQDRNIARDASK